MRTLGLVHNGDRIELSRLQVDRAVDFVDSTGDRVDVDFVTISRVYEIDRIGVTVVK